LEDQITIIKIDRNPRESRGEPARQLFVRLALSRELSVVPVRKKEHEIESQLKSLLK
jgi:hypothetical protein